MKNEKLLKASPNSNVHHSYQLIREKEHSSETVLKKATLSEILYYNYTSDKKVFVFYQKINKARFQSYSGLGTVQLLTDEPKKQKKLC